MTPSSPTASASSSRPPTSRIQTRFCVRPADVVDVLDFLGDAQRNVHVGKALVDLAGGAAVEAAGVERMPFDRPRADGTGDRQRLLGQLARLLESSREHQDLGETSHGPGPGGGRRLGRREAHRVAIRGIGEDPLARDPGVPAEPLVEHPGTDRIGGFVDERDGLLDLGDRAGGLMEFGDAGERGQERDPVDAGPRLGVGHLVPQFDGSLVFDARLRKGVPGFRRSAGGHGRLEGARQVVGGVPVIGKLCRMRRVDAGPRLECPSERGMPASPFARKDVVVHGLLEQGVAEGIAIHARPWIGDQDLAGDALAQGIEQRRLIEAGGVREERRVHALAGRGRQPQELLRRLREFGDACQQHVTERRRELGPAVVAGRDEQFLGEERVAVRAGMDRLDEGRREVVPGDGLELGGDVAQVERLETDPFDAPTPLKLGQIRQQRMPPMELVGAVRHDDRDRRVAEVAHKEPEQVARGPIGPVEILDEEEEGRGCREAFEDAEEELEQPALGRPDAQVGDRPVDRCPEIREESGELRAARPDDGVQLLGRRTAYEAAQGLDHRCVWQRPFADLDAAADEDRHPLLTRQLRHLGDEPRLADPGLARDEQRAASAAARVIECGAHAFGFGHPADEDRARDTDRHALDYQASHVGPSAWLVTVTSSGVTPRASSATSAAARTSAGGSATRVCARPGRTPSWRAAPVRPRPGVPGHAGRRWPRSRCTSSRSHPSRGPGRRSSMAPTVGLKARMGHRDGSVFRGERPGHPGRTAAQHAAVA